MPASGLSRPHEACGRIDADACLRYEQWRFNPGKTMPTRLSPALFRAALFALFALASAQAGAAEALRIAAQKTGTLGWELAVARAFALDAQARLDLQVTELASPEAGKIALQGGSADIIVSDWLYVARERGEGAKFTLAPYSTSIGAVMTRDAAIKNVKDLAGKKLGVAGGAVDKSWLLLKAFALKNGVDLENSAAVFYGAPPLIAEKLAQGELDAALEFWNFAVDLEAQGFRRAIELADVEQALGARSAPVVTGYVFTDDFAAKHSDMLTRFLALGQKARALIASDDKAWDIVAARLGKKDKATLDLYRKRYVAGFPTRSTAEEEKDAAALYRVLVEIGGEKLVGKAKTLDPKTFYTAGETKR
jgi:NitT/TauT family transport system substrate-binding protein